jgi:hypothetical protein
MRSILPASRSNGRASPFFGPPWASRVPHTKREQLCRFADHIIAALHFLKFDVKTHFEGLDMAIRILQGQ